MRNCLVFFLAFFPGAFLFAEGFENFENFPENLSTYSDGSFSGRDGILWTFYQCRGDIAIIDEAPCLGKNRTPVAHVFSDSISGGIKSFNFDYMQAFSSDVFLEVYINDVWVATVNTSNEEGFVKNSGQITVDIPGNFVVKFIQASNSSGQVCIDNFYYLSYGENPQTEPLNHPSSFIANAYGLAIEIDWLDSYGQPKPLSYLIKASTSPDIEPPVDGVTETDDLDFSDGSAIKNIPYGAETYTFRGLQSATQYFFKIYPYSNYGSIIDYKNVNAPEVSEFSHTKINAEDFEDGTFGSWTSYSVSSDKDWFVDNSAAAVSTVYSACMNGENENENSNDWLISPRIDLSSWDNPILVFYSQWLDGFSSSELVLKYSENYSGGDPSLATWSILNFVKPELESLWTHSDYVLINSVDDSLYVAFNYTSSSDPRKWNVDEIEISGISTAFDPRITVIQPSEGNQWIQGTQHLIEWLAINTEDSVFIEYTDSSSVSNPQWFMLNDGLEADAEGWLWNIPADQAPGDDYQIRISDFSSRTIGLSAVFSLITPPYIPDVVINEIMYNPSDNQGEDAYYEYIELFNNDSIVADLSDWKFTEGFDFVLPDGSFLNPGHFMLIARNPDSVEYFYDIEGVIGPWFSGTLNDEGDSIKLETSQSFEVDRLVFDSESPWPEEANGNGPSIELIGPWLDNFLPENWNASDSAFGTPLDYNSMTISDSIIVVENPNGGEEWELGSTQLIEWTYYYSSNPLKVELVKETGVDIVIADSVPDTGQWEWVIPDDILPGEDYKIRLTDLFNSEVNDLSDSNFIIYGDPNLPSFVITEIMYNPPESGTDSLEFIEIYNNDEQSFNLLGFSIQGGISFSFPDYNFDAGAYILVCGDSLAIQNTFNVNAFQWESGLLSNAGDLLFIKDSLGRTIDSLIYDDVYPWPPEADGDGPSIRFCDPELDNSIGENWEPSVEFAGINAEGDSLFASPGSDCSFGSSGLVITEIMYNPPVSGTDTLEFIEIYNKNDEAQSLSGCTLNDAISFTFPDIDINPGAFVVIAKDQTAFITNFGLPAYQWETGSLSDTGANIILKDALGYVVDFVPYSHLMPWDTLANAYGHSLSFCNPDMDNRYPFHWMASQELSLILNSGDTVWASPYESCSACPIDIVFSEIMYKLPGDASDSLEFLELYNNSCRSIDLKDFQITNALEFVFPEKILPPGGFFIVAKDSIAFSNFYQKQAYSWGNQELNDNGGILLLLDAEGLLLDSVSYEHLSPWDTLANGYGHSLVFLNPETDNALAQNWTHSMDFIGLLSDDSVYASPGIPCSAMLPNADFISSKTAVLQGDSLNFIDLSSADPQYWQWSFPGGYPSSSFIQHPENIIYNQAGVYDVSLTVSNSFSTNTIEKTDYINVNDSIIFPIVISEIMYNPPEAGYDSLEFIELFNNHTSSVDLKNYSLQGGIDYQFPDTSIAASSFYLISIDSLAFFNTFGLSAYTWDQGDLSNEGDVLLLYNQFNLLVDSVAYDNEAPWPVGPDGQGNSLTFCNPDNDNGIAENWSASTQVAAINANNDTIWASPSALCPTSPPLAAFESSDTVINPGNLIDFYDLSSGNPVSWLWAFEGGQPDTSFQQNPGNIAYPEEGTFDVSLSVSNDYGENTFTAVDFIRVGEAPVINFQADIVFISPGDQVHFSDFSSNSPQEWNWVFEGGEPPSSSAQNPFITYQEAGSFDVSLTASNEFGENTLIKYDYINVSVGIDPNTLSIPFAYPNPAIDYLILQFNPEDKNLVISDVFGKEVKRFSIAKSMMNIPVYDLDNGMYFCKILSCNERVFRVLRFIKQ